MPSGINASLSGLNAAATRLDVSANNIANSQSTKRLENGIETNQVFKPASVTDVSLGGSTGGVKSVISTVSPSSFLETNAAGRSNVDFAKETVSQIEAKNAYRANLVTLEAQNKTIEETLNIIS